jgi:tetratricopeptide (TPR) repeat protein
MTHLDRVGCHVATWGLALTAFFTVLVAVASAQTPPQRRGPGIDMQVVAESLGVECEYCHGARQTTLSGRLRLDVAREMIAMTADLNARVQLATGKAATEAVRVECATCHHGVPVPKPLRDLMLDAAVRQGPDAAAKLYRDLREKYFGSQSYDFSESSLLTVADRLAQSRPDAAIALADLNIEFYPKSWRSYLAKGIAQSRRLDTTPDAVESFKRALEIDPENGVVQGWLAQTEPVARRVR